MIFLPMLLMMQSGYSPETEAVINRSRVRAQQQAPKPHIDEKSLYLPPEIASELQKCVDAAIDDQAAGEAYALRWAGRGGGFSAGQCLGFAYSRAGKWQEAVAAFEGAARSAQSGNSQSDAARLWAQAGNAALAGGMAERARDDLGAALAGGGLAGLARGEAYLDRARALVALNNLSAARADIDQALVLAADDPLAWLLSATLARRMTDLQRAAHDIAEAEKRAPDDASVALEAGKVAILTGDDAKARAQWERAVTLAPDSEQASAAREMIAQLDRAGSGGPVSAPETDGR